MGNSTFPHLKLVGNGDTDICIINGSISVGRIQQSHSQMPLTGNRSTIVNYKKYCVILLISPTSQTCIFQKLNLIASKKFRPQRYTLNFNTTEDSSGLLLYETLLLIPEVDQNLSTQLKTKLSINFFFYASANDVFDNQLTRHSVV